MPATASAVRTFASPKSSSFTPVFPSMMLAGPQLRRECLDHMIVSSEASLYRHVKLFLAYYHESRVQLSLAKDTPEPRPVHRPELGPVVAIPQVGGLHHRYERRAA